MDPDRWFRGATRERPGAEGSVRIAPPERRPQGDSAIPPGSIRFEGQPGRPEQRSPRLATFDTPLARALSSAGRRTRVCAYGRQARLRAFGRRRTSARGPTERIAHSPDEANVPAQEAPSRQGARLPRTHADVGRPTRDRRQAGTRSEATDGLTDGRGSNSPRLVMLSRPKDFAAVQGSGTSRSNSLLTARFLRTDLETTRFGLSTGRKLGGAVVRNRARRRIREALRVMAPSFQPGWDVLIIARPAIVDADHATVVGALRRLLHRGGVFGGPAAT
jgi:ribonuclease P protein component